MKQATQIPDTTSISTATMDAPTLVLDTSACVAGDTALEQMQRDSTAVQLDEQLLTPAERKTVDDFSKSIDISDANIVLLYGAAAQQNIAQFATNTLADVRSKDLGAIGVTLSEMVVTLQQCTVPEKKGIMGLFQRKKTEFEMFRAAYDNAEANIDKVVTTLEQHKVSLMKDVVMLDQMYVLNEKYYKELTMYILAGNKKLHEVTTGQLAQLRAQATASGKQEDAQAYNDLANMCVRFDKKLHDLMLSRAVSIQMGPQTRLIQNNDALMLEKIQSSLVNTIPLWKSQMVLAVGLNHTRKATEAQNAVTDMTNTLLRQNADLLHVGTTAVATASERSIIDITTLQHTNEQLIESLNEVMQIQTEGAQKRREAEAELSRIEGDLKQKMLELRTA
ncbi:MAG: toxic anion resistance protein [Ruthenibacterium sp.]